MKSNGLAEYGLSASLAVLALYIMYLAMGGSPVRVPVLF
jgi:hypothetical protein